jgi:aminoglycoside phosphotransferase family enzyme
MEPLQTLPGAGKSFSGPDAPTLDDKVRFLGCPATYSCASRQVVVRETHMSWVFMAGERVYKLKKPVRFAYLDFSTMDRRAAACRAEYLLKRRLAPDVYLDVVPHTLSTSGLAISGDGPVVDWLVVMRRLEENETLEAALRGGWLKPLQVDRLAATLGRFTRTRLASSLNTSSILSHGRRRSSTIAACCSTLASASPNAAWNARRHDSWRVPREVLAMRWKH